MNLPTSKILVAVAFGLFVVGAVITAVTTGVKTPDFWVCSGLAAWSLAVLV